MQLLGLTTIEFVALLACGLELVWILMVNGAFERFLRDRDRDGNR